MAGDGGVSVGPLARLRCRRLRAPGRPGGAVEGAGWRAAEGPAGPARARGLAMQARVGGAVGWSRPLGAGTATLTPVPDFSQGDLSLFQPAPRWPGPPALSPGGPKGQDRPQKDSLWGGGWGQAGGMCSQSLHTPAPSLRPAEPSGLGSENSGPGRARWSGHAALCVAPARHPSPHSPQVASKQTVLPRNPMGRTGLRGRGALGCFGPNHTLQPVITR